NRKTNRPARLIAQKHVDSASEQWVPNITDCFTAHFRQNLSPTSKQAIVDFDRALELDPKLDQAYIIRREMYRLLEDPQQIIEGLDGVLARNPIAWAYICRGETYSKIKEYRQAIEDFNRALTLDSNSAAAYYNRGLAYRYLKEYKHAIKDFDRALKLEI